LIAAKRGLSKPQDRTRERRHEGFDFQPIVDEGRRAKFDFEPFEHESRLRASQRIMAKADLAQPFGSATLEETSVRGVIDAAREVRVFLVDSDCGPVHKFRHRLRPSERVYFDRSRREW
jgi:hypothetical protein